MAAQKHITDLACRRLKAGSVLSDTSPHRGLRLVASPKGYKVWQYRFKYPSGRMRQTRFGEYPRMSVADARRLLDDRRDVIGAGQPVEVVTQGPLTIGPKKATRLSRATISQNPVKEAVLC